jgi:serine protease inhibitor
MWLFLPDEGVTPEQLMGAGDIFDFLAQNPHLPNSSYENQKSIMVNLSLPKFDISSEADLIGQLKAMGVTNIFTPGAADFSPIFPEPDGGFVNQVQHAARVAVDEEGVTAAAFTVIGYCGAGMPPTDEMDLVFDRPFAFVIESNDNLPLFAGIVNEP